MATSRQDERLDKIAYRIFAELYDEQGYGETAAWNEAYKRAAEIINKK